MRVYTFVSKQGDSIPIAQRIAQEGHRVQFYINDKDAREVGNGIVEKHKEAGVLVAPSGKVDNKVLDNLLSPTPDCIIMDMVGNGFGVAADKYRRAGIPVIGGCEWGDRIELDRPFGAKVMQTTGINSPKSHVFTDYAKAIAFVKKTRDVYVYKPSGNQPTTTTYVAQGPEDLIGMLEFYSKDIHEEFELQEKVQGIEISTELWFNGKDVLNVNHTMEEKALMEGGKGPKTGCMGSVVWIGNEKSRIYKESLGKLIPLLKKIKYKGPLDINAIVNKDHFWGLEFTARFGYDAIFILLEMMKNKINDLLYSTATGTYIPVKFKANIGIGIDLAIPPYPLADCDPGLYKDTLIQGLNKHNLKHVWTYDVYKKKERYLASGNGGDIGTVTARGDDIQGFSPLRDAKRRAMRTINNLVIPDVMYRTDIGNRVEREREQLVKWGWM